MSFYSNLATTAARLLAQFGQDVEIIRVTQGDYSPDDGIAAAPEIGQVFKGAVFDVQAGVKEIRGQLVQADDKEMILESTAQPKAADKVKVPAIGGSVYAILSVDTLAPAGTAVIYKVHLRR